MLQKIFALVCIILFFPFSKTTAEINLDSINPTQEITSQVFVAESAPDSIQFETLNYQPVQQNEIQKNYSSKDIWFKLSFKNSSPQIQNRVLYFSSPLVGKMELYREGQNQPIQKSGTGYPLQSRVLQTRLGAFDISFGQNQVETFYIHRSSHHTLSTKIYLSEHSQFQKNESDATTVFFFYFGGILCLFLFNMVIGLYTSEKSFLYYSFFALSFGLTALTLQGVLDSHVFTGSLFLFSDYLMLFSSLSLVSSALFVCNYLEIKTILPKYNIGLRFIYASALISLLASFFVSKNHDLFFFGYLVDVTILLGTAYYIFLGIKALQKGSRIAIFFLLSWLFIFGGIITWFASQQGLIPLTQWTEYSLLVANMGEMLILSLGLAFKINTLYKEKNIAEINSKDKDRYHRLVKVLSHDIANAVTILSSYSNKLKIKVTEPESAIAVEKIIKNIKNLKDMLYLVRSEEALHSFKESVQLKPIQLTEVAAETFHYFEDKFNEKQLKFIIEIEDEGLCVLADRTALINQVVANLVSNSIKFSHPTQSIYFKAFRKNNMIHIQIKDEGVGIAPEDIQNIFFKNNIVSSKGTAKEDGTGLGTSLVREYMLIFNGSIEVSSSTSDPCGTTVNLIFPN